MYIVCAGCSACLDPLLRQQMVFTQGRALTQCVAEATTCVRCLQVLGLPSPQAR